MPKDIKALIQGYKRFRDQYFGAGPTTYETLTKFGQHPKVIMIACSDSRVDPAIVTNCDPGDIFVVRNIANLVPPSVENSYPFGTSAALEFAIVNLKVHHVVILGHSRCGGIEALMQGENSLSSDSPLADWMKLAEASRERALVDGVHKSFADKCEICAKDSLLHSLANLETFSFIRERVEERELFLHAWYFDLATGIIYEYNPATLNFEVLALD